MDTGSNGSGRVGTTYRDSQPWWEPLPRPAADAPNVIVVVLDDVGYGSIGCCGSEIATPTMDRLADDGLQYTNFHVTALCSPTRASLLTGRNHHSVGMSLLSNADSGFPSKRGSISPRAATIAETLRDNGYSTAAFGKWHVAPIDRTSSVGPFDQWPLGRGFERYYGFLEGITDHFHPELVEDNHRVDPPATPEEGYHLTEDLVDHAIDYLSDHASIAPEKPYFLYLAFGAAHTPHQAPQPYLDRYRGAYDVGWDEIRRQRHARQIELGVIPPDTELAPRNDGVRAWQELSEDEQRVTARMQEAFAAMLTHTDDQLGRLVQHLEVLGLREDTVIVLMSDNGASQEGGEGGTINTIAYENGDDGDLADALAQIDDIGGPRNHSNYPWGWAQAGNTPLRRYKQNTHGGGIRAPLVINWPRGIRQPGKRSQFHHVIDVTPTLLDLVGVSMPATYRGVAQLPVHGRSMRYSFDEPDAVSQRTTQYFEMYGHRAIWHQGWKAVAYHQRGSDYDEDRWELYHLATDFSETRDLAAERPDVLHELIGRWWSEADRYDVFPLDDRNFAERAAQYHSPASPRRRRRFRLYPGVAPLPGGVSPLIYDRPYRIDAHVTVGAADHGVLLAHGDVNGGHVLYLAEGRLHYEYNHQGTRYRVAGEPRPLDGEHVLSVDVCPTGSLRAEATLLIDDQPVGRGSLDSTARYMISWQGVTIGRDRLSPVSWDIPSGFDFTGRLRHVDIILGEVAVEPKHECID